MEVVETYLQRLEAISPKLNAIVQLQAAGNDHQSQGLRTFRSLESMLISSSANWQVSIWFSNESVVTKKTAVFFRTFSRVRNSQARQFLSG